MRTTRAGGLKTLLLALLWALSVAALCVPLTGVAQDAGSTGWERTLPDTGLWLVAAVAVALGYRSLGQRRRSFGNVRLWILALLFAAVTTLGESFANTGTAELVTAQKKLAFLYCAGRVPLFYMGMALLLQALTRYPVPAATGSRQTDGVPVPVPAWVESARKRAYTEPVEDEKPVRKPYRPPVPEWAAQWAEKRTALSQPAPVSQPVDDAMPGFPEPSVPGANPETVAQQAEPFRSRPTDTSQGAWAAQADKPLPYLPAAVANVAHAERAGLPVWGSALLLLVCWLPYLYAVWPGTVSNDSITQLKQIFGLIPLENGNPLAQTGLLWLAVRAGTGLFGSADAAVALYVCVQASLMAWLLGDTLRKIAYSGSPRWLVGLSTAFFALCPIFPVFAFCVGKDTVFSMAVLWLTLSVWRMLTALRPRATDTLCLCLSAAACALLRNAGAVLAGITLAAMLIRSLSVKRLSWRAPLMGLVVIGASLGLLYGVAVPALHALSARETENWSAPLQQVARTVAGGGLTDSELAAINAVLPTDQLQAVYNGELSDPVKTLWRSDATPEQKSAFYATWFRLGLKHPATYASAFFHNTYGYLMPGYVSTIKPNFLLGQQGHREKLAGIFDFSVSNRSAALKNTLQTLFDYAPFRLLCAPGLYGWFALFALAGVMGCRRRENAIAMLPALLTLLGCLFSAVNGYFRYAMPLYFMAPVLLALLSQALRSGQRGLQRAETQTEKELQI